MASRLFQRRIVSALLRSQPHTPAVKDPSWQLLPSWRKNPLYGLERHSPLFSTLTSVEQDDKENLLETAAGEVKYSASSSLKTSPRHDLAMVFTCKVCETRSVKTVSRESYEKGVVVARCGGCDNLHLLADRLGWFGEPGSIEEFLAARGEEVKKGSADTLSLTPEDLAGLQSIQ